MATLRRYQMASTIWVVVILAAAVAMFLWSPIVMRWYDPQAGDLGVDILQPAVVAIVYGCIGTVYAGLMAAFVERALKEQSFGPWLSRFATLFVLFLFCFCLLAAAIL